MDHDNDSDVDNDDDDDDDTQYRDYSTCRGDQGKDQFPWQSKEVHDVVSARGHLLLPFLAFLSLFIVIWMVDIKIRIQSTIFVLSETK